MKEDTNRPTNEQLVLETKQEIRFKWLLLHLKYVLCFVESKPKIQEFIVWRLVSDTSQVFAHSILSEMVKMDGSNTFIKKTIGIFAW